ncbi:hypothetical protein B0181_08400 [Moraxella caviae]|uniref:Uncharacterized protein n=1 Tax=Moraxella caviae TaxID=34060 RepID=A0A1S9ZXN0_9GAMM|nr:hypothetical protein [Moraxella caviae]OOR88254.1 hypothetical protein B0181_08400 [Moraxella caviae]STZ13914.1 Uncharacterised protein [Moraxella caviae]
MGFLTHQIGYKRLNQRPIFLLILFYFICFIFSFAGNFNAVYTNYQTEQLYRDEITAHKQQLLDVLAASNKALDNFAPDDHRQAVRVESLTQQLVSQITDSARPGLGNQARDLIRQIEAILGEKLTEFAGSPQELAQKYSENITAIAQKKFGESDYGRAQAIKVRNTQLANELDGLMEEALFDPEALKERGSAHVLNLQVVNGINQIGTDTQEFVNDPERFSFEKTHVKTQELGKIAFSFKSGFTQHIFVALMLSLFCIFVDWAMIVFLLVHYGRGEVEPYQPNINKAIDL